MLELEDDFAFVGKTYDLDDNWFRVDLLFSTAVYAAANRRSKSGKFSYSDAGQMNMYLNYAQEHWTLPDENPPIGLVSLCRRKEPEKHIMLWQVCLTPFWQENIRCNYLMRNDSQMNSFEHRG